MINSINSSQNLSIYSHYIQPTFNKILSIAIAIFNQIQKWWNQFSYQAPKISVKVDTDKVSVININPKKTEAIEPIEERRVVAQSSFNVAYKCFSTDMLIRKNPTDIINLKKEIEEYNRNHTEKLKIAFGEKSEIIMSSFDGSEIDLGIPILVGYSAYEFNSVIVQPGCEFLRKYFCHHKGTILMKPEYHGSLTADFATHISVDNLKEKYKEQFIVDASNIKVTFPELPAFTGSSSDIKKVFESLLTNQDGVFIGEVHSNQTPKQVLKDQFRNLSEMGVKTLFLEHCCYDTLQDELDRFFETKTASSFLEHFLTNGFGGFLGKTNYYTMIKAAVDAGIRPVGLERSNTQKLGYKSLGGSQGEDRMLGLNVGAKEIIEKHKKEGKYIALVGSAHVSYYCNIAGLSELCNAPSLIINDSNEYRYNKNLRNLGITDASEVADVFKNNGYDHFVHAKISLPRS